MNPPEQPKFRSGRLKVYRTRDPNRRPPRAAYALPTLFTAGNLFLGFLAIMRGFEGSMRVLGGHTGPVVEWEIAAKMIGWAVVLDGLDGRIARMTNTVSDFGREMDSLSDVITFCVAPAVLAVLWGIQFMVTPQQGVIPEQVRHFGYFFAFTFLLCGAMRLARFNVQTNPVPKNPGRPDRKYFVGLPTPAAAAMVAALIYAADGTPLQWLAYSYGVGPLQCWLVSVLWIALLALLSFLMVSTWRYRSFKDLNLRRPMAPIMIVFCGSVIYLLWYYAQWMLLVLITTYVASGILIRIGGILRRRSPSSGTSPKLEPHAG